jgi:carbonic anhydrase/acetyltransferase-like protein (isoleucine patch superfamily)
VLIGMGAIIMDDVVVQDQVMVGAGSLVPPGKVLESGHLYVGRPAAKVRGADAGRNRLPQILRRALRARQEQLPGRDDLI